MLHMEPLSCHPVRVIQFSAHQYCHFYSNNYPLHLLLKCIKIQCQLNPKVHMYVWEYKHRISHNYMQVAQTKNLRSRCGLCEGCLRTDCGKCSLCLDMKKFGGPGKKEKACKLRKCMGLPRSVQQPTTTTTPCKHNKF